MSLKNHVAVVLSVFAISFLAMTVLVPLPEVRAGVVGPIQSDQAASICVMADLRYSVGAYVEGETDNYRCVRILGEEAAPAGVAWVPLEIQTWEVRQPSNEGSLCTLPDTDRYSVGAYVEFRDTLYRCVNVRGVNLDSLGAMWIEIESVDGLESPA